MEDTLVFVDDGFLGKLSKHLGKEKYIKFDRVGFCKNLAKKQGLNCKRIFYFTAAPFQSNPSTKEEDMRKKRHDKFIFKLRESPLIKIEEGRVQKIIDSNGEVRYSQKGVDTLLIMRLSFVPIDFPNIKKVILVSSDTDFCPVIEGLKSKGVEVILYSYHEKIRNAKFSVSNYLIKCCSQYIKLTKQDFENAPLKRGN
tara:strand:- start:42 stop:635 length:594 start_codon:yes stop_codon:yes gene_type:complete